MLNLRRSVRLARTEAGKELPWERIEILTDPIHVFTDCRTDSSGTIEKRHNQHELWAIAYANGKDEFVIIPYDEFRVQVQEKKWELYTGLAPNK